VSFWRRLLGRVRGDKADKAAEATTSQRQRLLDSPDESDAPAPPDPLALCAADAPRAGSATEQRLEKVVSELRDGPRQPQPGLESDLLQMIEALVQEGQLRRAREYLLRLIHLLPTLSGLSLALAEMDYEQRQLEQALPRLESLLGEPRCALRAHFLLGDHHRREANLARALRHFEEVLARDFTYPRARARAEDIRGRLDRPVAAAAPTILGDREVGTSGRYVLQRELGRGGGGTVYLATDGNLGRPAAVKILHPHVARQASARAHLFCEARIAASLPHPQIVAIYDLDEQLNLVAMEYCRGGTLADVVAAGPRPLGHALERLAEMANVLDTVHRAGVVHRDIKPANWLLRGDRGAELAPLVLSDFGIAHAQLEEDAELDGGLSPADSPFAGSRAYMPPEQRLGAAPDAAVDIYATGVVFVGLVAGRPALTPNQALQGTQVLDIAENRAALRHGVPSDLADAIEALCEQLLRADPGQRVEDAATLAARARQLATACAEASQRDELAAELQRRAGPTPRSDQVERWLAERLRALARAPADA
jgi:tetratricopeptide (TPR) repeat protein